MARPAGGRFHRNELAILGAPSSLIQKLSRELASSLRNHMTLGYADLDHREETNQGPFSMTCLDKGGHHELNFTQDDLTYEYRRLFQDVDGVIINGNHFRAAAQIVIAHQKTEELLDGKLDQLTQVKAVLLDDGITEISPLLAEHIGTLHDLPILRISDTEAITQVVLQYMRHIPPIKGLVFAGGQSIRMGRDKGAINYHGKPQREHMADILSEFTENTYLSVRESA
ncbi:MAG: NTP transferase domain-containing protein, partial [Bacteroidota bacterium]